MPNGKGENKNEKRKEEIKKKIIDRGKRKL